MTISTKQQVLDELAAAQTVLATLADRTTSGTITPVALADLETHGDALGECITVVTGLA